MIRIFTPIFTKLNDIVRERLTLQTSSSKDSSAPPVCKLIVSIHIKYNVSVKKNKFYYKNCYFRATYFDYFRVIFRPSKVQIQALGSCDRASWAKCEAREKNQQDPTIRCLLLTSVTTCFGHHYAHLQENKYRVTAFGVLRWFSWLWLVAVVGRCVVGCILQQLDVYY